MKKFLPLLMIVPMAIPFAVMFAADPQGFAVWKASELKAKEKELTGKMNEKKLATEKLTTYGNHYTMMAHREADGEAEVHDKYADFFVIESGEATLVVGGTAVNPHTTEPGETRGSSITGGEKKLLGVGDVVHIPAKVPHQMLVANGKKVTYFVIKVEEK